MGAGILDLFPSDVGDCGGGSCVDVLLVFVEKVINKLLHLMSIAIVNGCPCFLYDLVDLNRVGGEGAWCVGCSWVCWSLDGLHGLGMLLLDHSVDRGLPFRSGKLGC